MARVLNEQRFCRTCLRTEDLAPIFTKVERHEKYSMALYLCTGLQVKLAENLSQLICNDCIDSMKRALEFRKQSRRAEKVQLHLHRKRKKLKQNGLKNIHFNGGAEKTDQLDINDAKFKAEATFSGESREHNVCDDYGFSRTETVKHVCQENVSVSIYKKFRDLLHGAVGGPGPYRCRACFKTLQKWDSFKQHAKIHLGFDFLCEICGKTFISSAVLRRHGMTRHGAERTHRCTQCQYCAVAPHQLEVHVRREHTGERPFVCDECGVGFRTRPHLIHHLTVHRVDRPVQVGGVSYQLRQCSVWPATENCTQCPATFKSSQHLACHTSKVHRARSWRAKCYVCGKTYSKLEYVRRHVSRLHCVPFHQQQTIDKVRVHPECL